MAIHSLKEFNLKIFQSLSSKTKHKRSNKISQGWSCEDPYPIAAVLNCPVDYIVRTLTKTQIAVYNFLLVWENSFRVLFFAQDTIALSLKISRCTVNRAIRDLKKLGLLAVKNRGRTSCEYRITRWLRDINVRESLKNIFSAFLTFPVPLLFKQKTPPSEPRKATQEDSFSITNINYKVIVTSDSAREGTKMSTKVPRVVLPKERQVILVTKRDFLVEQFKKITSVAALAAALCGSKVSSDRRRDPKARQKYTHSGKESMYKNKYLPPDDPWSQERVAPSAKASYSNETPSSTPKRRDMIATPYPVISREDSLRQKAASDDRAELSQLQRGKTWRKTFAQDWVYRKDNGL